MPKCYRKFDKAAPPGTTYVGRPTRWGNPFTHKDGTLAEFKVDTVGEAIEKYESWLLSQPDLLAKVKAELRGRDLSCWCAKSGGVTVDDLPWVCHGQVLLKVANE